MYTTTNKKKMLQPFHKHVMLAGYVFGTLWSVLSSFQYELLHQVNRAAGMSKSLTISMFHSRCT